MSSKRKKSIIYEILFPLVWWSAQIFYRKFTIKGIGNIPDKKEPAILISNHQNGMMDPIMLCISNPRPLHFLTRADIFKKKSINKILRSVNMMPVYRPQDKNQDAKKLNAITYEECTNRILDGHVISLFPEGNHLNRRKLRPIKSGVIKVVINALKKAPNGQDIKIIPVGLDYSNYTRFREDLLIMYGEPIKVLDYLSVDNLTDIKAGSKLREAIENSLKKEMINIELPETYDCLTNSRALITSLTIGSDLYNAEPQEKFIAFKTSVEKIEKGLIINPEKSLQMVNAFDGYEESKKKHKLYESGIIDGIREELSLSKSNILIALGFPVFIMGWILNILPLLFTERFVKKNIKDPHFISSIRIAIGLFTYLIYYGIVFSLCWIVWGFILAFSMISFFIFTAVFALHFSDFRMRVKNFKRFNLLTKSDKNKVLEQRNNLISLIQKLMNNQ